MTNSGYKGIWIETANLLSINAPDRSPEEALGAPGSIGIFAKGRAGDQESISFVNGVCSDLALISSRPIGRDLIKLIGQRCGGFGTGGIDRGLYVTIKKRIAWDESRAGRRLVPDGSGGMRWVYKRLQDPMSARAAAAGGDVARPRSSVIEYNPSIDMSWTVPILPNPSWLVLAHELIHAYHALSGSKKIGIAPSGVEVEELYTVGLGPYFHTRISENAIRLEHHLPIRDRYNRDGPAIGR